MSFDNVENITAGDLLGLIGTAERKRREYKKELPKASSEARKEFVADVSSMANTEGGDIFYGIEEDRRTHLASAVPGVPTVDAENQIATVQNVLRDSIRPRLPHLEMQLVDIDGRNSVFMVRVGRSHLAPHHNLLNLRFFARNTNGKYPLDVSELSDMILRREALPDRMRKFRRDRLDVIRFSPEEMPSPVTREQKLVLHFMPEQSFGRLEVIDVGQLNQPTVRSRIASPAVLDTLGLSWRANIDGFMFMNGKANTEYQWYAQVFYDGTVEITNGVAFAIAQGQDFHPAWVEDHVFQAFKFVRETYRALGLRSRVTIFVSLLGVRAFEASLGIFLRKIEYTGHSTAIGRDPALYNEVTIADMEEDEKMAVWPIAQQLWRSVGFSAAISYDNSGNYIGYEQR